jgi:uncharacterized membrane protein
MNSLPKITLVYSGVLIVLGLVAYFVWGNQSSTTALIPSYAGGLFLLAGLVACKGLQPKALMYFTLGLAALLLLATVGSVTKIPALLQGAEVARPLAVKVQFVTALTTLVYIGFWIRSFKKSR